MAEAKKTQEPKRMYVNGKVRVDLWRQFRIILLRSGRNVTEGLEAAITEWLAVEGKAL